VVVNLSSKPLNSAKSSLLSKGLNFCRNPPKINVRELDEDLDQFARRLRIEEYFHSKRETSEDLSTDELDIKKVIDIPRFVKKSNWIPKPNKTTRLESVIDLIRSDTKHNVDVHVPKTDNLTQTERSALRDLQERDDIIIKPADKGSAVVVMDKTTYLQEAERQLSDCRFYEKLDSDPALDFTQKIKRTLEAMHVRGHIDDKTM
jgi:tRNA/tmRNA/rRNA uracil-C5-methylase (TrmA/RlmC/RlmD family)